MSSICLTDLAPLTRDTVVCLGTFDGVHRGHQALIARAAQVGREQGLLPCAYTFDAPPAAVLTHQQAHGRKGGADGALWNRSGGLQPL